MECKEFFRKLSEASAWALNMGDCVIGVYSLDKPGTVKRFMTEQADSESYGVPVTSARAVVVFVR